MAMWSPASRMYDRSLQPADVDEHARLGQAQLHQRQQAVAAGEELGVVAVLADQADRLLGRPGPHVVERGGDHDGSVCRVGGWRGWPFHTVLGTGRHRDVGDAEAGQRVDDGVDDGRGGADGAGLADALDAERVGRRRRDGVAERERRDVAGRRHQVLGERASSCRLPSASYTASSNSAWARPWMTPPWTWPVDDQRVDLHAAVVDGDVLQHVDGAGLGVDLDDADVRAERPREVGRVVGDLRLEVRLEAVGQVVGGERLERDRGERHRPVGRALDA